MQLSWLSHNGRERANKSLRRRQQILLLRGKGEKKLYIPFGLVGLLVVIVSVT
jgi:hypothetical protein